LPEVIEKQEKRNLSLSELKDLVREVEEKLPDNLREKLKQNLSKNPSYFEISNLKEQRENFNYQYAPLTGVGAARTFPQAKHILSDQRSSMSEENFKHRCVFYCNSIKLND